MSNAEILEKFHALIACHGKHDALLSFWRHEVPRYDSSVTKGIIDTLKYIGDRQPFCVPRKMARMLHC
jgi:hypothetical protein